MELKIEQLPVSALKPYERNTRKHTAKDVGKIAESIKLYGFNDPIGIWGPECLVVEGHGRLQAAKLLGLETVPVIRLDHLSEDQRREYAIAHNRIAELSAWDFPALNLELQDASSLIKAFDLESLQPIAAQSFHAKTGAEKEAVAEGTEEYDAFLDKFKPKKTTDDCYTPDAVYEAVAEWVAAEYGVARSVFVRPFYPGGDYKSFPYGDGNIVVDNPPFSILAEIERFYLDKKIPFFLFAPALSLFNSSSLGPGCCCLCAGVQIVYDNGASVPTSFVTSLEPGDVMARTAPELTASLQAAADLVAGASREELKQNVYPDQVVTAALMQKWSKYGVAFSVMRPDGVLINELDAQKAAGRTIYGRGLLLSERAAAERAAAERAAAERAAATKWTLSAREQELSASLGK